jgi:hypothetical protein
MKFTKMLGIAAMAMLVLAVTASAASAAKFHVEGTTGPFTVKADQIAEENHIFTIEGGLETKCKTAHFEGTQAGTEAATLTVHPEYSGCTAFGLSATINTASCKYEFLEPTGTGPFTGSLNIVNCSTPITITAGTCKVTVTNQGPIGSVTYTNEATTPKTVKVAASVTGITYTKTEDGFLCPLNGTGTNSDGTYKGDTIAKGFEGVTQKGVFVG